MIPPSVPENHRAVLSAVSKSKQVGGDAVLLRLYSVCFQLLETNNAASIPGTELSKSRITCDVGNSQKVYLAAVTDMKTGVYIQLSKPVGGGTTLMTVGQKHAMEGADPANSQIVSKIF
jgi:hypothetical protein